MQKNYPTVEISYQSRDSLMPKRGTLSIKKASKLIGYEPKFPLEKGLQRYIDWYKSLKRSDRFEAKTVFID